MHLKISFDLLGKQIINMNHIDNAVRNLAGNANNANRIYSLVMHLTKESRLALFKGIENSPGIRKVIEIYYPEDLV